MYHLLPSHVKGNLSALCVWPDQIRHWHKYRWTSPLHFIDTPDDKCGFQYSSKHCFMCKLLLSCALVIYLKILMQELVDVTIGDCHDSHGVKDMCVAGAIKNFTSQLLHYREGTADRRCKGVKFLTFLELILFHNRIF